MCLVHLTLTVLCSIEGQLDKFQGVLCWNICPVLFKSFDALAGAVPQRVFIKLWPFLSPKVNLTDFNTKSPYDICII